MSEAVKTAGCALLFVVGFTLVGVGIEEIYSRNTKPPAHEGLVLYSLWDDCVAISNEVVLFRSRTPKGMEDGERKRMLAHIKSIDGHQR